MPKAPPRKFNKYQASKLGSPSLSNNYQVVSIKTTFILFYMICPIIGATLCYILFLFVIAFCYLQSLYLALLFGRDHIMHYSSLIMETNLEPCFGTLPKRGIIIGGIYTTIAASMMICELFIIGLRVLSTI